MAFLAPAVPWIIKGASAVGGLLAGRSAQNAAQQRSPEEQAALGGANQAGSTLQSTGTSLINQGQPYTQQAGNYFQTLLRGNRAQQSQATAAPRGAISDLYGGAQRGLEQSGVRGAARDVASSELNRERTGRIASLISGVQPAAAGQLASMGAQTTGQGLTATGAAGGLYQNLLGDAFKNRVYARDQGQQAGSSIGSLIYDVASGAWGARKGNKGTSGMGNTGYTPNDTNGWG